MKSTEALVTVTVFETSFDASLARDALEAIGIPASVAEAVAIERPSNSPGLQIRILDVTADDAQVPPDP